MDRLDKICNRCIDSRKLAPCAHCKKPTLHRLIKSPDGKTFGFCLECETLRNFEDWQ